ncbi:Pantothenate synthetase [compost metagenome]
MIRVSSRQELRDSLTRLKKPEARVGFVPTMGYLHEGHASLIRLARQTSDVVVVSIFVNPKQFGPNEDLDRYPRDLERDMQLCAQEGVDLLFTPRPEDVYPPGFRTQVSVSGLTEPLCGASRPGHFTGVTTVVARLFGLVRPDRAFFGQKDFQQWRVIAQMVEDLALPVEVVRGPIVRETDGLALSSRNTYLSAEDRKRSLALSRALAQAMRMLLAGERSAEAVLAAAQAELANVDVEYLELRDADTLQPVAKLERPAVMAIAAKVGKTRLIDNALLASDSPDRNLPRLLEGASL